MKDVVLTAEKIAQAREALRKRKADAQIFPIAKAYADGIMEIFDIFEIAPEEEDE